MKKFVKMLQIYIFFIAVKLSPLASSPSPSLHSRSSSRSPIRYVEDDTLVPNGGQSPRGASSPPVSPIKSSSDEAEEEQPPPPPPPQSVSISASKKRKASGTPSTTSTGNFLNDINIRGVGDWWAGRAIAHPGFGRSNNPISIPLNSSFS